MALGIRSVINPTPVHVPASSLLALNAAGDPCRRCRSREAATCRNVLCDTVIPSAVSCVSLHPQIPGGSSP